MPNKAIVGAPLRYWSESPGATSKAYIGHSTVPNDPKNAYELIGPSSPPPVTQQTIQMPIDPSSLTLWKLVEALHYLENLRAQQHEPYRQPYVQP